MNKSLIIAKRQLTVLDRATRKSDALTRQLVRSVRAQASAAAANGRKLRTLAPGQKAIDELTDLMVFAYVSRLRVQRRHKRFNLELSSFDQDLKRAADSLALNLDNLRSKFSTTAEKNLKGLTSRVRNGINDELAKAVKDGVTTRTAVKRVANRMDRMGVSVHNKAYIETVVRTHSQIAYNAAHFMQHAADPDVWGFEYVTVGDDRVRPEHEALDGIIRKKSDLFWSSYWPPNGWNCRCQVIAIYEKTRQTRLPKSISVPSEFEINFGELVSQ